MTKLYKATSLDDIAKQFRNKAVLTTALMNREVNRDKRNHYAGEVVAYNAAATVLENMEIVESIGDLGAL